MKGRGDPSSASLWSFSAPPPTPTTRPCVPRVQPVPIQLSSSYQGEDVFSLMIMASPSSSRSLNSSRPTPPSAAACFNGSHLRTVSSSFSYSSSLLRRRDPTDEEDTILSVLKQPSPDRQEDDEAYDRRIDVEDELQFTLTLS